MNYFQKFRQMRYKKDAALPCDIPASILWIDEDMLEGRVLGNSMRRVLTVLNVKTPIIYTGHDEAIDALLEGYYSFIILDNDSYRGTAQGPETLQKIREIDGETPIVYTTAMPEDIGQNTRRMVQEVIRTTDIPKKISDLIEKYSTEVKK